jgi:murein DD-endopeptidase MepM/ murein hydrolase activator NlpD
MGTFRPRVVPGVVLTLRLALTAGLASFLAGCADSDRLSDPFGNPFHSTSHFVDPNATGTIPSQSVQSRPLPAPANYQAVNSPSPAYSAPSTPNPSFGAPRPPAPDVTNSVPRGQNIAGWTADGGTPIVVAQGETADLIARRYGIPSEALLRTNGFTASNQVRPGTRLIIPVYNAALAAASGMRLTKHNPPPPEKATKTKVAEKDKKDDDDRRRVAHKSDKHEIDKHETKVAREDPKPHKDSAPPKREIAKHEEAKPPVEPRAKNQTVARETGRESPKQEIAKADPPPQSPKKIAVDPTTTSTLPAEANDAPEFRWPAHGRVISCFKCSGNDGINIALPEGTAIKAAEAGTVAYAGDLKNYGNLVLIKHPNGYVTAYANNGEISVKVGEQVKRGQTIAKSGQSGNVPSPQLHFEVRKGKTPVDPQLYLAGL